MIVPLTSGVFHAISLFLRKNKLEQHLKLCGHTLKPFCCKNVYRSKAQLSLHMKAEHPKKGKEG